MVGPLRILFLATVRHPGCEAATIDVLTRIRVQPADGMRRACVVDPDAALATRPAPEFSSTVP
jgi:hypothetical protein